MATNISEAYDLDTRLYDLIPATVKSDVICYTSICIEADNRYGLTRCNSCKDLVLVIEDTKSGQTFTIIKYS